MTDRREGSIQQDPEAKRVRASSNNVRLDLRISGYDYQNSFQEHVQRLEDLQRMASEPVHVDWFECYVVNPDHEHAV